MLPELVRRAQPAVLVVARKEQQMTTTPQTFHSGTVMPAEAIHVTGRRVVATLIDGLIFGTAYWLLALPSGMSAPKAKPPTGSATSRSGPASPTACS